MIDFFTVIGKKKIAPLVRYLKKWIRRNKSERGDVS